MFFHTSFEREFFHFVIDFIACINQYNLEVLEKPRESLMIFHTSFERGLFIFVIDFIACLNHYNLVVFE